MAKVTGILTHLRGSIGDVTFSRVGGQTVAKQKVEKKSTPKRTLAVMTNRMQWRNIQNLYRAFEGRLHPSFEGKSAQHTDYNEFMSANSGLAQVYLTRAQARQGGAVVAGYQITRGSLPSISLSTGMGGEVVTNISVNGITIDNSTTVKQLADAVVEANVDFEYGDEITVFIAEQTENSETHTPYVKIFSEQITLDGTDNVTKVRDLVGIPGFSVVDGNLGTAAPVDGAVAYVHSRKTSSGNRVSTQHFRVNNSFLPTYTSEAALKAAIESYGGLNSQEWLVPDAA